MLRRGKTFGLPLRRQDAKYVSAIFRVNPGQRLGPLMKASHRLSVAGGQNRAENSFRRTQKRGPCSVGPRQLVLQPMGLSLCIDCGESLVQIGNEILRVLQADANAEEALVSPRIDGNQTLIMP